MKIQELVEATNFDKQQVIVWLDNNGVKNYRINRDLSVDVDGNVDLSKHVIRILPVKFNEVGHNFFCDNNHLTSLQGTPRSIGRDFYCDNNKLTSLEGGPQEIGDDFYCDNNELTSLEGGPQKVDGDFYCYDNPITSLHNIHRQVPEIKGELILPVTIKSHILGLMRIRGLQNASITYSDKQLSQALEIINNNLDGKGNIHTAQEQLLDAGLAEFAQI